MVTDESSFRFTIESILGKYHSQPLKIQAYTQYACAVYIAEQNAKKIDELKNFIEQLYDDDVELVE